MGNLVNVNGNFDIEEIDFFRANPLLRYIEPFSTIRENKSQKIASKICWSVYLFADNSPSNKIYDLPDDQKLSSIKRYYKTFNPDEKYTALLIKHYPTVCMTPIQRSFAAEDRSIRKRTAMQQRIDDYLEQLVKDDPSVIIKRENKELLQLAEKMRADSLKIYNSYNKAKDLFDKETEKLRLHGGGSESLMEQGGLANINTDEDG